MPQRRSSVWSCRTTISPSRVRRRSISTMSAPRATADANAGSVFSRWRTGSPRWAMAVTRGAAPAAGPRRCPPRKPRAPRDVGATGPPEVGAPRPGTSSLRMLRKNGRAKNAAMTHWSTPATTRGTRRPHRAATLPATRAPTGAAPHTTPRHAPPTRPISSAGVSRWRREIATTEPAPTAKPTSAKAGPARTQLRAEAMIRYPTPEITAAPRRVRPLPRRRTRPSAVTLPRSVPRAPAARKTP